MTATDLTPVVQRLDALAAQVSYLAEQQRARQELFTELMPVARAALATAITQLDALDQRGYFAFFAELAGVAWRVIEGFSPADVRQLGDAVVAILETVRALTQPEVLQVAADASAAVQDADQVKPIGMFGALHATRNEDVQRGMALLVEVLRQVGKGVQRIASGQEAPGDRKAKLAALLGPRRAQRALAPRAPEPAVAPPSGPAAVSAPACATPAHPARATAPERGAAAPVTTGASAEPAMWSRPLADELARTEGIVLGDAHWAVIDAARADFATTQVSPNIRRLTQIAQLSTKDLYALFPRAPGRTIARIAGLPKPAGCL